MKTQIIPRNTQYPEDSKYYDDTNNLVEGKMKHEPCGVSIKDFVGLKSKTHTFITAANHESKEASIKVLLLINFSLNKILGVETYHLCTKSLIRIKIFFFLISSMKNNTELTLLFVRTVV